jgi:carboxyl-terminal processing protease
MKRKLIFLVLAIIAIAGSGFLAYDNVYLKINKNIDIFGKVYKEIVTSYVDDVDPEKFMHAGIDAMLESLDPYTIYIGEKESEDIELITHGQYGGIGVSIGVRDGNITVIAPMEGYSAHRQGMRTGDIIIEIDGISVVNRNLDSVRAMVRGEPGTEVRVKVEREGETKPIEFVLIREEIQINNVSYTEYRKDGIGYIRLERFSRRAGEEVRQALKNLKARGELRGLILDLRNNPGGLLESAVEVTSNFVPRGSTIVSTRGRRPEDTKIYTAEDDPIVPTVPLVILINRNSASASEIVAGAIQDLDRGILVGTRSFGKGLVQTITQLGYNTTLKITTARYYTPSGRSIQELDYKQRNRDGVFAITPDSLKHEYKTSRGRIVLDLGGISPDSSVNPEESSTYTQELLRKSLFFKYVTRYAAQHAVAPSDGISDAILADFRQYVSTQKFEFKDNAQKKIEELREALDKENYGSLIIASIDSLERTLQSDHQSAFDRSSSQLRRELEEEIISRYEGEKGRIRIALQYDEQMKTAVGLISSKTKYATTLKGK